MKTLLIWALAGALGGIATASIIVPPALSWYSAPGGLPKGAQIQALVEIPEVIRYSTGRLIRGQAIGAVVGAVLGVVVGVVGRRRRPAPEPVQSTSRPPEAEPPHRH
jgi:ABC-type nitrate/sulfonate/bicarbonate transport system permease component